ncbi:unnamed protein product (macronuclear) [Paramecium tetraurelia]|uniref:Enkurin domain-containing protein n=1 Tax=Paramecium tetraurelia TaxID=5888 RepID=A0D251_PARTE|nr:uncharacterized protein GSPATT00012624001 [Paramecium tetraurelia]CAK77118.1 unnamed protein product [Paramecium tetraurelia]|eukprot:XP_001444515.1 hypothetical protein (macronuclear) [Paramecium tetraurelia strain d4-2]
MKGILSRQSSLSNINHNVNQALGVSSQYDFEKGILVNVPVELPEVKKNSNQKLPRLMRREQKLQKFFVLNPKQQIKSIERSKTKRLIPYQLIKVERPPIGYYKLNESSLVHKSVVDMSKQPTARIPIRQYKSKSIDQEPQMPHPQLLEEPKKINKPRITELSNLKLQEWIHKELEQLKDAKKLQQTTYKGFMANEKEKSDNFQRLFELTSLKLKNSYVKYFF